MAITSEAAWRIKFRSIGSTFETFCANGPGFSISGGQLTGDFPLRSGTFDLVTHNGCRNFCEQLNIFVGGHDSDSASKTATGLSEFVFTTSIFPGYHSHAVAFELLQKLTQTPSTVSSANFYSVQKRKRRLWAVLTPLVDYAA
jgi:hypothetical protein